MLDGVAEEVTYANYYLSNSDMYSTMSYTYVTMIKERSFSAQAFRFATLQRKKYAERR